LEFQTIDWGQALMKKAEINCAAGRRVYEMIRILVVNDDAVTRNAVSTYLKYCGYDVLTAADGLEGVRLFSLLPGSDRRCCDRSANAEDDRTRSGTSDMGNAP
jgi:hypothetical protein